MTLHDGANVVRDLDGKGPTIAYLKGPNVEGTCIAVVRRFRPGPIDQSALKGSQKPVVATNLHIDCNNPVGSGTVPALKVLFAMQEIS